eukprot:TRINITY_DN1805_c0_g1_i1.p1 TRINITY_DN1805_c0_g1~~TRINITY_DN1805_c0_g1_i1.p1  ORF type:complete len:354 (+),score=30.28 TRINITY_DN1805_c0_g1_i1:136-1062(+)
MRSEITLEKNPIHLILSGLKDSVGITEKKGYHWLWYYQLKTRPEIRSAVMSTCIRNMAIIIATFIVTGIIGNGYLRLLAYLGYRMTWVEYYHPAVIFIFLVFFTIPAGFLSTFLNGKDYVIIAKTIKGEPRDYLTLDPVTSLNDTLVALVFQLVMAIQLSVIGYLPFPFNWMINLPYSCWLYSNYCFDWKWSMYPVEQGKSRKKFLQPLKDRLAFFYDGWLYYLGYGFPFYFAEVLISYYFSVGFWAGRLFYYVLFPFFLISSLEVSRTTLSRKKKYERLQTLPMFHYQIKLSHFILDLCSKIFCKHN